MTVLQAILVQATPESDKEVFTSCQLLAARFFVHSIEIVRIVGSSGDSDGKRLPNPPSGPAKADKPEKVDKPAKSGKPRGRPKGSGKKPKPEDQAGEPEPIPEPEPGIPEYAPSIPIETESPLPGEDESELPLPDAGRL